MQYSFQIPIDHRGHKSAHKIFEYLRLELILEQELHSELWSTNDQEFLKWETLSWQSIFWNEKFNRNIISVQRWLSNCTIKFLFSSPADMPNVSYNKTSKNLHDILKFTMIETKNWLRDE